MLVAKRVGGKEPRTHTVWLMHDALLTCRRRGVSILHSGPFREST